MSSHKEDGWLEPKPTDPHDGGVTADAEEADDEEEEGEEEEEEEEGEDSLASSE